MVFALQLQGRGGGEHRYNVESKGGYENVGTMTWMLQACSYEGTDETLAPACVVSQALDPY